MRIISCAQCDRKLRVPDGEGNIKCPHCGERMRLEADDRGSDATDDIKSKTLKVKTLFKCFSCDSVLSVPVGVSVKFDCPKCSSGRSCYEGQFSEGSSGGLFTGVMSLYYPDGRKCWEDHYVNGFLEGLRIRNSHNDREETYYKKGEEHGKHKIVWNNGKIRVEGEYFQGSKVGIWKEYFENGKLLYEGEYDNGEGVGIWKFYNQTGLREQVEFFGNEYSETNYDRRGNVVTLTNKKNDLRHGLQRIELRMAQPKERVLFVECYYINGRCDEVTRIVDELGRATDEEPNIIKSVLNRRDR